MRSLQTRALIGGVVWGAITTILCGVVLVSYLGQQSQGRFSSLAEARHTQVLVAVANYNTVPDYFASAITDPYYQRPFSGRYWQARGPDGALFVSPSLVDDVLPLPDRPHTGVLKSTVEGPGADSLLVLGQMITLDNGGQWYVQAASSFDALAEETTLLRRSLVTAFGLIFAIGAVGLFMFVQSILRPLHRLRKDVAGRWDHKEGLDAHAYPIEVAPLVTDINSLLVGNREILANARRQAADLAHAMKTPAAIIRNELATLQTQGADVTEAFYSLDRLDGQLQRALARQRGDGAAAASAPFTDVSDALFRMQRAFTALAANTDKNFSAMLASDLRLRIDKADFEEMIGNLLDNALKWSETSFEIEAREHAGTALHIKITDDGPGIPEADLDLATRSGQRLDVSQPGTGLGLAIAGDLVRAYGGKMTLARSKSMGGLAVSISLPLAAGPLHSDAALRPAAE
jgi:signal transduction histidine kinase